MASGIFWTVLQALGRKPSQLSRTPSRIFWAVLQAEMHSGAMLTWGFIDATVNLSIKTIQNSEPMAKNGPKTCKTTQNYMSEVDSRQPALCKAGSLSKAGCQCKVSCLYKDACLRRRQRAEIANASQPTGHNREIARFIRNGIMRNGNPFARPSSVNRKHPTRKRLCLNVACESSAVRARPFRFAKPLVI